MFGRKILSWLTVSLLIFMPACGSIDQLVVDKVAGAIEQTLNDQELAAIQRFDESMVEYGITSGSYDENANGRIELDEINDLLEDVLIEAILPAVGEGDFGVAMAVLKELVIFLTLGPVSNEIQEYLHSLQSE